MNMEVDKQTFRGLVEGDRIGQALNQLSDISHFLGQGELQDELQDLAEQYQELQEMAEDEEGREELQLKVKNGLLELIDRLPEEFSPEAGDQEGSGGCLGVITLVVLLALCLLAAV